MNLKGGAVLTPANLKRNKQFKYFLVELAQTQLGRRLWECYKTHTAQEMYYIYIHKI